MGNDSSGEPLIDEVTQEAIKSNRFVAHTLNLTRLFLLAAHADWSSISRETGRPAFREDEALTLYNALCVILDDKELPEGIEDVVVDIGSGNMMKAGIVLELAESEV